MPNSITQGLTTCTNTDLNKLTAFQTVTLLGLLAQVDPKCPDKEVRTTVSNILQIIEVSKQVAHAVEREWEDKHGETHKRKYACRRHSPWYVQQIHEALLVLHNQSVSIQRYDAKYERRKQERIVHILDSFGYCYERDGTPLDLDDLPPGTEKVNIASDERPVYRVLRRDKDGKRFDRPTSILFRLNSELAHELNRCKGTVGFTIVASKVFGIFREFMRQPAAIRLTLLILRQTQDSFSRTLSQVNQELGWDVSHPTRAVEHLCEALDVLQELGMVHNFDADVVADRVEINVRRDWYLDRAEGNKA